MICETFITACGNLYTNMVADMELSGYKPITEPQFGRVVHKLKFYPQLEQLRDEYQRPVELRGLIARELVSFLNSRVDFGFECEGSLASSGITAVSYNGRRILTVNQEGSFRVNVMVNIVHPRVNDCVEQFLKEYYPIRKSVWMEAC